MVSIQLVKQIIHRHSILFLPRN